MHAACLILLTLLPGANVGYDLTGTVLDVEGQPLAGASVFISTAKPREGRGILCPSCYADCAKSARTAADGTFRIESLDQGLLFRVLVAAEDYLPQFADDVDPAKEPREVRLKALPKDVSSKDMLRGRVLDQRGKPIAGATVEPFGYKTPDRRWWGPNPDVDPLAVTNLEGEFLITCRSPTEEIDVKVDGPRHAARIYQSLPTGAKAHEFALEDGAIVSGTILNDGQPVEGIAVGLCQSDRGSNSFLGAMSIATDEQGRFMFQAVYPDNEFYIYTTMGSGKGRGTIPIERFAVGKSNTSLELGEFHLRPTHRVSGRVVLTDGKPLPQPSRIFIGREEAWDSLQRVLKPDGGFAVEGLPTEAIKFSVRVAGYRLSVNRNRSQIVGAGGVAVFVDRDLDDLEIVLEPDGAK
jgi:protocatechuate 3,4-dioxygenase beta subunit